MKKSALFAALLMVGGVFALSACNSKPTTKRHGFDSAACRAKCQRVGKHVAVTESGDSGKCVCQNDSTSEA